MARRRTQQSRWGLGGRISSVDRRTTGIGVAAVILLLALVMPRVYPAAKQGPTCSDLAPPIGGNNRSILAQTGSDRQSLDLNLSLENDTIRINEPLQVRLTFVNEDSGPVILYLNPLTPSLSRYEGSAGITFEITRIDTNVALVDPVAPPAPPTTFDPDEELHLLGARARCTETFEFSATKLQSIGLAQGEYRIRAFYRNNNPGDPAPIRPANATATPAYFDQGVWTGDVSSEEVIFTVIQPGASTPVP
ncbi:MAG: hypothetical protein JXJ20_10980 [Anaerolineae bacterium]|nr:hypothetical protein [Anaerolineae bacterium]